MREESKNIAMSGDRLHPGGLRRLEQVQGPPSPMCRPWLREARQLLPRPLFGPFSAPQGRAVARHTDSRSETGEGDGLLGSVLRATRQSQRAVRNALRARAFRSAAL